MNLRKELHLTRSAEISGVLARHGLDYLVGTLGLEQFAATKKLLAQVNHKSGLTQPEHLRMSRRNEGEVRNNRLCGVRDPILNVLNSL